MLERSSGSPLVRPASQFEERSVAAGVVKAVGCPDTPGYVYPPCLPHFWSVGCFAAQKKENSPTQQLHLFTWAPPGSSVPPLPASPTPNSKPLAVVAGKGAQRGTFLVPRQKRLCGGTLPPCEVRLRALLLTPVLLSFSPLPFLLASRPFSSKNSQRPECLSFKLPTT